MEPHNPEPTFLDNKVFLLTDSGYDIWVEILDGTTPNILWECYLDPGDEDADDMGRCSWFSWVVVDSARKNAIIQAMQRGYVTKDEARAVLNADFLAEMPELQMDHVQPVTFDFYGTTSS